MTLVTTKPVPSPALPGPCSGGRQQHRQDSSGSGRGPHRAQRGSGRRTAAAWCGEGSGGGPFSPHGEASPCGSQPRAYSPSPSAASALSWGSSPGWQTWRSPPARVEDRVSETFLSSPASPPTDLTLGFGHWYQRGAATWDRSPPSPSPVPRLGSADEQTPAAWGLPGLCIPHLFLSLFSLACPGVKPCTKLMPISFLLAPHCLPMSPETRGTPGSSHLHFLRAETRPRSQRDSEDSGLLLPSWRPTPANWSSGKLEALWGEPSKTPWDPSVVSGPGQSQEPPTVPTAASRVCSFGPKAGSPFAMWALASPVASWH